MAWLGGGGRGMPGRSSAGGRSVKNVTLAGGVPLQLAAHEDPARELVDHRFAAIGVVGDTSPNLAYALASRRVPRGLDLCRARPITTRRAVVSRS